MNETTHRAVGLRPLLRRVGPARSAYHLWKEALGAVRDSPAGAREETEEWYGHEADPWRYGTTAEEQERYALALEMVDRNQEERRPPALEIGCGEGLFTIELARRCGSVLGLDFSAVALARARDRCSSLAHVSFKEWDARVDVLEDQYELVTCMDFLSNFQRPWVRRRAMRRIAGAVAPGGLLVFSDVFKHPVVEQSCWARWFGTGSRWMVERLAGHRRLRQVAIRTTEHHVVAAFAASG